MQSSRWKSASLAINAIIRGLELDQIAFRYDEAAGGEGAFASARRGIWSELETDVQVVFLDNDTPS